MWCWRRTREASGRQGSMLVQRAHKIYRMMITMGGALCMRAVEPYPPLLPVGGNSRKPRLPHFIGVCLSIFMLSGCALITPYDETPLKRVTAQDLTALLPHR